MNRFQISGAVWLVAAASSALTTVIFRDDVTWYAVTLVASAAAAVVGLLLLWRPLHATVLLSSVAGIAWVALYAALIVIQAADIQAWTADAFLGLVGAIAAIVAFLADRTALA